MAAWPTSAQMLPPGALGGQSNADASPDRGWATFATVQNTCAIRLTEHAWPTPKPWTRTDLSTIIMIDPSRAAE